MKYNKRLLIIIGVSAVLFVGSILTFTSCTKNPTEDTNTNINDKVEEDNTSSDKEQNNKSEEDKEENITTEDKDNEDDNIQDDNTDSDKNTQDKENINNNENSSSNNSNNNQSSNNSSTGSNTTPDNSEETNNSSTGNMEINKEGIYAVDGHYFKSISSLDEKSVLKAATYLNSIKETYLTDKNKVFYAVIPDKTYYDKSSSYDKLDYDKMITILNENIKDIEYIKLKDLLSLDDFYKTDNHWRQESIFDIANRIGEKLNFKINANNFEKKSYNGFKGMYSKYVTDTKFKEELFYHTNSSTTNATVDNYQNKFTSVYDTDRLATDISYDVFLSGATPFLTITNSSANSEKELVIFRDSYTSSLAPLLVSEYSKITLIDTRYMASSLIKDFIEFDNQDVLFLYSSAVINNSAMLK